MAADAGVERLVALIESRATDAVIDLARSTATGDGIDAAVALLAAAQVEVGWRWQSRRWTVADEHAATAIIDTALSAAAFAARPVSSASRGRIVVTCVEEEWHVVPARMFAAQLTARNWDVTFLGASTPADHLGDYLTATAPDAVALSCSIPIHLPGALRSINACRAAAVPAVIGGRALGSTADRAEALGADAWAATAEGASRIASDWLTSSPPPPPPTARADEGAQLALAAQRSEIAEHAMDLLAARAPAVVTCTPTHRTRTREDLDFILRYTEAALLVGDDSIIGEFIAWRRVVLDPAGSPPDTLTMVLETLIECVPPEQADALRLLEVAQEVAAIPEGS